MNELITDNVLQNNKEKTDPIATLKTIWSAQLKRYFNDYSTTGHQGFLWYKKAPRAPRVKMFRFASILVDSISRTRVTFRNYRNSY